jgi:hypothetical protein
MDISYTGSINKPLVFRDVGFCARKGQTISLGEWAIRPRIAQASPKPIPGVSGKNGRSMDNASYHANEFPPPKVAAPSATATGQALGCYTWKVRSCRFYPYESISRLTNGLRHPSSPQNHFPPFPFGKWGEQNHNKNIISQGVIGRLCEMKLLSFPWIL